MLTKQVVAAVVLAVPADPGRIAKNSMAFVVLVAPEMAAVVVILRFPMFLLDILLVSGCCLSRLLCMCAKHIILITFWQCDERMMVSTEFSCCFF